MPPVQLLGDLTMAHFVQLDANNVVTQVIVVSNGDCGGGNYPESEPIGAAFCHQLFGGTWKQTSYNNNFRKRYAGIGYTYNEDLDAFIAHKPFESWTLNPETADWEAPVPYPSDGNTYTWNEFLLIWEPMVPAPGPQD